MGSVDKLRRSWSIGPPVWCFETRTLPVHSGEVLVHDNRPVFHATLNGPSAIRLASRPLVQPDRHAAMR